MSRASDGNARPLALAPASPPARGTVPENWAQMAIRPGAPTSAVPGDESNIFHSHIICVFLFFAFEGAGLRLGVFKVVIGSLSNCTEVI